MTEMTEADRKAFEEWVGGVLLKDGDGNYMSTHTAVCFRIYQAALTHARGKQDPVAWPNRCDDSAVKALRFLADHERPNGGESRYNFAHLMQIASEIETFSKRPLYAAPPAESEELARLREALAPFADVANLLDAETEGVSDTDDMDLMLGDYIAYRFPVSAFKDARAALAASPAPETDINAACVQSTISKPKINRLPRKEAWGWEIEFSTLEDIRDRAGEYAISTDLEAVEAIAIEVERRILSAIEGEGDE